ncbi:MAG: TylF/MycF/NovP-related O-methyltransferase [Candidatus Omnitrophota bacterium]|nr:TylF/MycF/NovP-related O-methyltransferase [Candidatus Omnitrophota bacterium]
MDLTRVKKGINDIVFRWLIRPHVKRLVKYSLKDQRKHFLKDRKMHELLKTRLESIDLEEQLFKDAKPCGKRFELLSRAVEQAKRFDGGELWLEFGVEAGASINHIAGEVQSTVYGFDTFTGLPEAWKTGLYHHARKGKRSLDAVLPKVASNVELIPGLFEDTLQPFLEKHAEPVAFVHIDCDLYSSTKTVFRQLKLQVGSVIAFDEYYNYPNWREGEYKAFHEFLAESQMTAKCLGFCPRSGQAAFILC